MKRLINVLGAVLGLQVVLAVILGFTASHVGGVASSQPLLRFDAKAVDRVTIEQPKKDALVLERKKGTWQLPALDGFPASTARVDTFLDKLAGLRKRFPVATSAGADKRFKVGANTYEHKIVLAGGGKTLATLWLGDSPNFRRIYGRAEGENAVYDFELAAHETSTDPNQWADRTVLSLKADDIAGVDLADAHLVRKDGKWQMKALPAGETVNADEAGTVADALANLSFEAVLGKHDKPDYKQGTPALSLSVTTKKGEHRSYVFSKPDKGSDYVLKTSASPYYFKVADFTVKPLLAAKRDKLANAAPKQSAPVATSGGEQAPANGAPGASHATAETALPIAATKAPAESISPTSRSQSPGSN